MNDPKTGRPIPVARIPRAFERVVDQPVAPATPPAAPIVEGLHLLRLPPGVDLHTHANEVMRLGCEAAEYERGFREWQAHRFDVGAQIARVQAGNDAAMAQIADAVVDRLEIRSVAGLVTREDGLAITTGAPAVEGRRAYLATDAERERRRKGIGEVNARLSATKAAQRAEAIRTAVVMLGRPIPGGGLWRLQQVVDRDLLAAETLSNWHPATSMATPRLHQVGRWLEQAFKEGQLKGSHVETKPN